MGDVVNMFGRPKKPNKQPDKSSKNHKLPVFEIDGTLAEYANKMMAVNLGRVAVFLGRSEATMPNRENIQVIDGIVQDKEVKYHPDGTVMNINTAKYKSLIVATDNFIDFFKNNRRDMDIAPIDEAALYVTAFAVASLARQKQRSMSRNLEFDTNIWRLCGVSEPSLVQGYRFAASVVNNQYGDIGPAEITYTPRVTYPVASFMNPLTPANAKDVVSPLFTY